MLVTRCTCFFCFKQKTAYEMRISDWSSDVCSSDLSVTLSVRGAQLAFLQLVAIARQEGLEPADLLEPLGQPHEVVGLAGGAVGDQAEGLAVGRVVHLRCVELAQQIQRSEEHTSELQSLMRISYAVFCLKKKN